MFLISNQYDVSTLSEAETGKWVQASFESAQWTQNFIHTHVERGTDGLMSHWMLRVHVY